MFIDMEDESLVDESEIIYGEMTNALNVFSECFSEIEIIDICNETKSMINEDYILYEDSSENEKEGIIRRLIDSIKATVSKWIANMFKLVFKAILFVNRVIAVLVHNLTEVGRKIIYKTKLDEKELVVITRRFGDDAIERDGFQIPILDVNGINELSECTSWFIGKLGANLKKLAGTFLFHHKDPSYHEQQRFNKDELNRQYTDFVTLRTQICQRHSLIYSRAVIDKPRFEKISNFFTAGKGKVIVDKGKSIWTEIRNFALHLKQKDWFYYSVVKIMIRSVIFHYTAAYRSVYYGYLILKAFTSQVVTSLKKVDITAPNAL